MLVEISNIGTIDFLNKDLLEKRNPLIDKKLEQLAFNLNDLFQLYSAQKSGKN